MKKSIVAGFLLFLAGPTRAAVGSENFGTYVLVGGLTTSTTTLAAELTRAQGLGIEWVRMNMNNWELIETSSGVFDYTYLDRIISLTTGTAAGQFGMGFLITLPISATWTPITETCPVTFQSLTVPCRHFPTNDAGLVRRLSKNLATRYSGPKVKMEIWNEMDFGYFWKGELAPKPTDYIVNVASPAYNGAKEGNADMTVIMGGMAFPIENPLTGAATNYVLRSWFREALQNGLADVTDKYNVHIYEDSTPAPTFDSTLSTMTTHATAESAIKNVWVTETSKFGGSYTTSDSLAEEQGKAEWLYKQYAQAVGDLGESGSETMKIEKTFWHTLMAYGSGGLDGDFSLYESTGAERPCAKAHNAFFEKFDGATFNANDSSGDLNLYRFTQPDGDTVYMAWCSAASCSWTPSPNPASVTRTEKNAVSTGLSGSGFQPYTLTNEPYIFEMENPNTIIRGVTFTGVSFGN